MSFSKSSRLLLLTVLAFVPSLSYARDASFLEPSAASSNTSDEAIKVDPKPEIDVGDTNVGVTKHITVFFVNQSPAPVKIEKVTVNGDANVKAEVGANDCAKQETIVASSRCSIDITVAPVSPGAWNVDLLMTHNGAGRITRARLSGKTSGAPLAEKKDDGLAVSAQEIRPVDFGEVNIGDGKTVRSTLMINDSPIPITIYAIDVIEADNGLQRLDQGCAVDMELLPGASCPVTLLWTPKVNGPISTDLIIRHSGRLGFAVIPVRGSAKGGDIAGASAKGSKGTYDKMPDLVPLPPSAKDLEKEMAGKLAPVSDATLVKPQPPSESHLYLIGTIGERALFLKPDGDTAVASVGDEIDMGNKKAKLIAVNAHAASLMIDGKRKDLPLQAVASLVASAQEAAQEAASKTSKSTSGSGSAPVKVDVGGDKK